MSELQLRNRVCPKCKERGYLDLHDATLTCRLCKKTFINPQPLTYTISINEHHLRVMKEALDLYSRIGLGQFDEVERLWRDDGRKKADHKYNETEEIDFDGMREKLKELKQMIGFTNGSWGIHCLSVPDHFRIAWDIKRVLRHRLAWDLNPEGAITVDFDEVRHSSRQPLITIKKDEP